MRLFSVVPCVCVLLASTSDGCNKVDNSDSKQAVETRNALSEAHRQVGMPDITKFTERKLARDIFELRDKEDLATYSYIVSLSGDLIFLGESIGYGLPYSAQFTNPQRIVDADREMDGTFSLGNDGFVIPQADPNGLFMPDSAAATWIMLKGPDGKVHAVYVEPEIIVSPFPLHHTKSVKESPSAEAR